MTDARELELWRIVNKAFQNSIEKFGDIFAKDVTRDLLANSVTVLPESGIGDMSDGYHTFNELYHHRAILFSVICNLHPLCSWKAKKHHDGTMYDGMFIVGINTPEGQATYHYDIDPYWDMFHVPEAEFAPTWDGHTPDEAIRRIGLLGVDGVTFATDNNVGSKWIPVTERLPDAGIEVLAMLQVDKFDGHSAHNVTTAVIMPSGSWLVADYQEGIEAETAGADCEDCCYWITHWMPLPQPPKGE